MSRAEKKEQTREEKSRNGEEKSRNGEEKTKPDTKERKPGQREKSLNQPETTPAFLLRKQVAVMAVGVRWNTTLVATASPGTPLPS